MMRINKPLVSILLLVFTLSSSELIYSQEKPAPQAKTSPTANLISLNLKDVNIEDALKIISEASSMNIILDKDVKAKINVTLKDVSWQTALDNILKTNEFTYRTQDNIIRVMTLATVKKEDETLPLTTKIITLNFAKAEEIQKSLTKMLSPRGSIEINVPTNSLIINDSPDIILKMHDIITNLDRRTPQVMVEALIISVKRTDLLGYGVNWTAQNKNRADRSVKQVLKSTAGTALDLITRKSILPTWQLDAEITAFASDDRVSILANPRVLTLDNLPAQIEINEQVPYTYVSTSTQSSSSVTSTQFKDVGIKLNVTPHITQDQTISLNVQGEQSFAAAFVGTTNEPSIDSRKVSTNFMLQDGYTAVIGGLKKKDISTTVEKIPLLGDIPFLGKILFSKIKNTTTDQELIIFITPHIMDGMLMTKREKRNFTDSNEELAGLTKAKKEHLRNFIIADALNKTPLPAKK